MVIEKHDEEDFYHELAQKHLRELAESTRDIREESDRRAAELLNDYFNSRARTDGRNNMVYDPDKGCVRGPHDRDDGNVCGGFGADRELGTRRIPLRTWMTKIDDNWKGTPEEIRELPDPIRWFIGVLQKKIEFMQKYPASEISGGEIRETETYPGEDERMRDAFAQAEPDTTNYTRDAEDWPLGWSADILHKTIAEIEGECEFAIVGPARAFFEVPPGNRFVYRVYGYVASTPDEALAGVKHQVLALLRGEPEGRSIAPTYEQEDALPGLFWRNKDKIKLERRTDGRWSARTRLVTTRDAG